MTSAGKVYCTLFDSYYLPRGVIMLRSLAKHGGPADRIYVFCFDDHVFQVLSRLGLDKVVPISLSDFETEELLEVKKSRSKGEYCWTCTPFVLLHVLEKTKERECTYVDADLYFYRDPTECIPREINETVLITEHRYTPKYDQTRTSGRFCVQFLTFKKEPQAMTLLRRWGKECLDWCFARHEDGKFGDQMYLDSWPAEGKWVKVSEDPWIGIAPWNIQQFQEEGFRPVFYHFHAVQKHAAGLYFLGSYELQDWVRRGVYKPYIDEWEKTQQELASLFGSPVENPSKRFGWKDFLKRWIFSERFVRV